MSLNPACVLSRQVIWGELGETPLDQLAALSRGVVMPLLSHPGNTAGVPAPLMQEVTENLQRFIATGKQSAPHVSSVHLCCFLLHLPRPYLHLFSISLCQISYLHELRHT